MKKIALFGGAFNPIHNGHIRLAKILDIRVNFDKILLIPSHISPHKDSSGLVEGARRLEMCRLVAEQEPKFEASDMELRRDGQSFTIDTVRELRGLYPEDKFYMILGSDMFLSLDSWRCSGELLQMVTVCASAREEGEYEELIQKQRRLDAMGVNSVICAAEALPISSTMIRERIRRGLPVDEFLPEAIARYIREHGLYQQTGGAVHAV